MIIESPSIACGRSAEFLTEHLGTPRNLETLLPPEHVSDFKVEDDGCSFKVTGGFQVVLLRVDSEMANAVRYVSQKGTPIRFTLDVFVQPISDAASTVQIHCDAELNPFMKMMAEKPLQNIFQGMAAAAERAFPVA
jgi:hypothetical protein